MSNERLSVRFYAVGERPWEEGSGYFPGGEDNDSPAHPTLIDLFPEQELPFFLTRSEIELKFCEVAQTDRAQEFNQLCVLWGSTIIAVQPITAGLTTRSKPLWILAQ